MTKWICAIVGYYITGSFLGAVAGYFIGKIIQGMMTSDNDASGYSSQRHGNGSNFGNGSYSNSGTYGYSRGGYSYSRGTTSGYSRPHTSTRQQDTRTLFLNSMLEMAAYIIAADGRIMHSEMEVMRSFLHKNFDQQTAEACNERLLTIFKEKKQMTASQWQMRVMQSCRRLTFALTQEQLLQFMALLAEICKADGRVDAQEEEAMKLVARTLGLGDGIVNQLLSLGGQTLDDAYRTLGIPSTATDDEVRRAYRKMALQYHPDRVATLGKDVQENAKRKFQEINEAKDRIYKARGM